MVIYTMQAVVHMQLGTFDKVPIRMSRLISRMLSSKTVLCDSIADKDVSVRDVRRGKYTSSCLAFSHKLGLLEYSLAFVNVFFLLYHDPIRNIIEAVACTCPHEWVAFYRSDPPNSVYQLLIVMARCFVLRIFSRGAQIDGI